MGPKQISEGARDALSVRRVFGEPVERDGVTVIPASAWLGGGGGGTSGGDADSAESTGMGFGGLAWPAGAYEIRDGRVRWHPATDWSRLLMILVPVILALIKALRSD